KRNTELTMCRCQLTICLFLLASGAVFGFSTQYRGNARHPTLRGHCYYEELELAVSINQTVYPVNQLDFCARVYCREDYVLILRHCDRMQLAAGCYFTPNDYTLSYPDCCAQRVCPN
ncbi:hypothetical protein KR222_002238, partial [Zaprionus bogoriensis]